MDRALARPGRPLHADGEVPEVTSDVPFSRDSVTHGSNPNATSACRFALPFSHVAAAALHSFADSSPLWTLLAQNCRECGCGHADGFLEESACFLLGRAAPDVCASSILLHRDGVLCSEAALAQAELLCICEHFDTYASQPARAQCLPADTTRTGVISSLAL